MIFNKTITIYFQNKNKWQIAPDLHKKSEKCDTSRNYEFFFVIETKRERGGREGRRARTAKREKGAKEQGRTLYTP